MNSRGIVFLLFGLLITISLGLIGINKLTQASPTRQELTTVAPPTNPFDEIEADTSPAPYQNPFEDTLSSQAPYKNPFE